MAIGITVPNITSRKVVPDKSLTRSTAPDVLRHQFGDGYEQRLKAGINTLRETYSISFVNRDKTEADDIIAFFDTKAGVDNFDFTIPDTNSTSTTTAVLASGPSTSLTLSLTAANLDISSGAAVTGTGVDGTPKVTENQAPNATIIVDTAQTINNGVTLTFTNPNEKTIKVVCSEWNLTYSQTENYAISCEFRRVYEP